MQDKRQPRSLTWALALVGFALLGSCRCMTEETCEPEVAPANPVFLLFGGPLGLLVECEAREQARREAADAPADATEGKASE